MNCEGGGRRHCQRGQVLGEFAIASATALLLILGIIDFGRAMFVYDFVANAARMGTRYAIVHAAPCNGGVTTSCELAVKNFIAANGTGIDQSKVQLIFTWEGTPTCAGTANPGCNVKLEVDYPFAFMMTPLPTLTLKSTSQMVISQ
jgi:Flp pilus assembly protein TadG